MGNGMTGPLRYCNLALRAAIVIVASAALMFEWSRASNATIFLGPFYFVWYARDVASCIVAIVLWIGVLSVALKPSAITACVSAISFALWLFFGMIGQVIGFSA